MKRWIAGLLFACLVALTHSSPANISNERAIQTHSVPVLNIRGAIGPAVGDYLIDELAKANATSDVPAIIITIDTPGGLVSSLRDINQQILASDIPVLCLVHPSGARAASAGTYILYACHIAAMSPATTLGAATPVQIGGASPGGNKEEKETQEPSAMEKKILNDSVAYIRSLAQLRGRNEEWAEKAVREAATLSASEALELNVINYIAEDPAALVKITDGETVTINDEPYTLNFNDATLVHKQPDWRNQFLTTITDPNIAYILMIIGIYGLLLEFYSPGFGIAGIIGAISLLIATYAFQLLPVNYVGLGLIFVGVALLIAESMVPSFGLFGFGGIVAFVLGSIFLIDSEVPELKVSLQLIYALAATSGAFILLVLKILWNLRKKQVVSGTESMIGGEGVVSDSFEKEGFIQIRGERWAARCNTPLQKGDPVQVDRIDGLTLIVRKITRE
ncbi:nodulation protein NfeD [Vibrio sp. JC009]|uniref:NfeD family protein n=1 Tax=Vibrio sp. JC009 TaxID=2912314 RepID=UPI0023AEDF86|nr:nodulation protein NfeD [Vibrio sp. JC009]WED24202.1 nodulation protein NfeD [Vibrio sp. JC009]